MAFVKLTYANQEDPTTLEAVGPCKVELATEQGLISQAFHPGSLIEVSYLDVAELPEPKTSKSAKPADDEDTSKAAAKK